MKLEIEQTGSNLAKPFNYKINLQYNYQKKETWKNENNIILLYIYYKWK